MYGRAEKMFKISSVIREVDIVPMLEIDMAMGDDAIDSWIFKDSCAVIGWSGFGSMVYAGEK